MITPKTKQETINHLNKLKLKHLASTFSQFCEGFGKHSGLVQKVIEDFTRCELEELTKVNLERRINFAKLGQFAPLSDFDWTWPKKCPKDKIENLMNLEFLDEKQNIILMGPEGVGKTMIAKNLAYQAAFNGKKAFFCTAAELVLRLKDTGNLFRNRLNSFVSPDLLVIDEIGYLSFDNKAADLLYQVISKRYERSSTVVTTNLTFKEWPKFFPGAACVTALVDRLVHRSQFIDILGDSYRLKQSMNSMHSHQQNQKKEK